MFEQRRWADGAAALLFLAAGCVFALGCVTVVRVQPGWQDEVYWYSTCLSMLRGGPQIPSVLADFPRSHNPLHFYGPTLFWAGTAFLKVFGASMVAWRSFTLTGLGLYLAAMALLFWRLTRSWVVTGLAALVFSLSLSSSFAVFRPGRPDSWGMAFVALALALAVAPDGRGGEAAARFAARWLAFGGLLALAATTNPRIWLLLFSIFATLPWLAPGERLKRLGLAVAGFAITLSVLLWPVHLTPWGYLAYVHRASSNDAIDISPLMGGSWDFHHAGTQIAFYGAVLLLLAVLGVAGWSRLGRFFRWICLFACVNLALSLVVLAGATNMTIYWGFPFEAALLLALISSVRGPWRAAARAIAVVLLCYLVALRAARELPTLLHWQARNPAATERALANMVPAGSLVYGSLSGPFFETESSGSTYRYLQDWTTPGRSSVPGVVGTLAPMQDACRQAAYLVWLPRSEAAPPALPHAASQFAGEFAGPVERRGVLERALAHVPGVGSTQEDPSFAVYRLEMDHEFCAAARGGLDGAHPAGR